MPFTRRDVLSRGSLFLAMGITAPTFLTKTAEVMAATNDAALTGPNSKGILVVVQLGGGNDGLNTVVPYGDPLYYKARPSIGVAQKDVIHLTDTIGLNPNLAALKTLYDAKQVAVVQGVGYPNPNRSHFRSTDIWLSGRPDIIEQTGWLGRYLDAECCGEDKPLTAVDSGDTVSTIFWTGHSIVPAISSLTALDFLTDQRFPNDRNNQVETLKLLNSGSSGQQYEDFVRQAATDALTTSDLLKSVAATYKTTVPYPDTAFARGLQTIARLIQADLGTRIFHITLGGFDTHAAERDHQDPLLKQVAEATQAFMHDLDAIKQAQNVTLMTFSEFGRRVVENASGGTDHGEAAPMFIVGGAVKSGIYGSDPDLVNLDLGDIKYTVDFRQVYSTMLQNVLGADAQMTSAVIGPGSFATLPFVGGGTEAGAGLAGASASGPPSQTAPVSLPLPKPPLASGSIAAR